MPSVLMISSSLVERLMSLIGNPGSIFVDTDILKIWRKKWIVIISIIFLYDTENILWAIFNQNCSIFIIFLSNWQSFLLLSSPNDQNAGFGHYGACCQELDIWEANAAATAFTVHPCDVEGFMVSRHFDIIFTGSNSMYFPISITFNSLNYHVQVPYSL